MYHVEKLIQGVWHFKSTPRGRWIRMTNTMLLQKEKEINAELLGALKVCVGRLKGEIHAPLAIIEAEAAIKKATL